MNTPDPFGIRQKSPRSPSAFVQSADYFASQVTKSVQSQLRETARSKLDRQDQPYLLLLLLPSLPT